jgi:hypothetical protein
MNSGWNSSLLVRKFLDEILWGSESSWYQPRETGSSQGPTVGLTAEEEMGGNVALFLLPFQPLGLTERVLFWQRKKAADSKSEGSISLTTLHEELKGPRHQGRWSNMRRGEWRSKSGGTRRQCLVARSVRRCNKVVIGPITGNVPNEATLQRIIVSCFGISDGVIALSHQQKVTELEATWENQYLRAPWWKIQLGQVMVQLRFQVNFLEELLEILFWNYGLWCHQGTSTCIQVIHK